MIGGEPVIVRLTPREADGRSISGAASIVGELKHQVPARYGGREFSIGNPYPERNPEHLAGGILFINEEAFEGATLTAVNGNDYFVISIKRAVWRSVFRTVTRPPVGRGSLQAQSIHVSRPTRLSRCPFVAKAIASSSPARRRMRSSARTTADIRMRRRGVLELALLVYASSGRAACATPSLGDW